MNHEYQSGQYIIRFNSVEHEDGSYWVDDFLVYHAKTNQPLTDLIKACKIADKVPEYFLKLIYEKQ